MGYYINNDAKNSQNEKQQWPLYHHSYNTPTPPFRRTSRVKVHKTKKKNSHCTVDHIIPPPTLSTPSERLSKQIHKTTNSNKHCIVVYIIPPPLFPRKSPKKIHKAKNSHCITVDIMPLPPQPSPGSLEKKNSETEKKQPLHHRLYNTPPFPKRASPKKFFRRKTTSTIASSFL